MSIAGKWGYSHNEGIYHGSFGSREEAIINSGDVRPVWVGQYREPITPESCVDGQDLIDNVLCQDDYDGDVGDGSIAASKSEVECLTAMLRGVFAAWLDLYGLRPTFGIIENAEKITS